MIKKILVTGASGFLGGYLAGELLKKKYNVTGTFFRNSTALKHLNAVRINLINKQEVDILFNTNQFDFIFHLAYSKDVFMKSVIINGTEHIYMNALKNKVPMIFVSTDLVFNGESGNYNEKDTPEPIIDYGRFKLEAEKLLKNYAYIVRTSLIFDSKRPDIMKNFTVNNLINNQPVNLFIDEFRSPIEVRDLIKGLIALMESKPEDKLWHIAGPQRISRYKFGAFLADRFMLNKDLINPSSIKSFEKPRPNDTSLDSQKFYSQFFPIPNYF